MSIIIIHLKNGTLSIKHPSLSPSSNSQKLPEIVILNDGAGNLMICDEIEINQPLPCRYTLKGFDRLWRDVPLAVAGLGDDDDDNHGGGNCDNDADDDDDDDDDSDDDDDGVYQECQPHLPQRSWPSLWDLAF